MENDRTRLAKMIAIGAGALVILGLGLTFVAGFLLPASDDRFAQCRASRIAGSNNVIGGPFSLIDENGARVTEEDVITGPTIVYFGYSYCPDVCPFDNARNAEVATIMRDQGAPVGDLFITIDPVRDTPEVLKEFTDYFDDEMIGLTGSEQEIADVAKTYRAYFAKNGEGEDYLMDHSTLTYLMAPDDGLLEVFRRDLPAEEMAERVSCFVQRL